MVNFIEHIENIEILDPDEILYIKGYNGKLKRNFKDKLVWASQLAYDGSIINYITMLGKKYSKSFVIIKYDLDQLNFFTEPHEKRLVASRISHSDYFTYSIPQHDEYFTGYLDIFERIPFSKKKDEIIWRGLERGSDSVRANLLDYINQCNLEINVNVEFGDQTTKQNFLTKYDQAKCKYIFVIDGHGWPGSINWTLLSGSVPIIISNNHVWYMDLLVPWKDYVPVSEVNGRFPDLVDNITKVINDQKLAEQISINAPKKITRILSKQKRYLELVFSTDKNYYEIIDIIRYEINNY
jgi:hypothetical protein